MNQKTHIGVLALQGDVEKHLAIIKKSGARAIPVRTAEEIKSIKGLIIPGGESTTIGMLLKRFKLFDILKQRIIHGLPVFGTCAGLILLAKKLINNTQTHLGCLDITVLRNAYGPQIESFEVDLNIPSLGEKPFQGVFIRAPIIKKNEKTVEILAEYETNPVLIRQKNILASTFHPELTKDIRIHEYFFKAFF